MSDVRGLVGIDAGVLDQHFAFGNFGKLSLIRGKRGGGFGPIHANVEIPAAGDFKFFDARDGADSGDDLLGNFAWRLAQLAGQFEGDRERVFSKLNFRRLLDHDICNFELIGAAQKVAHGVDESAFELSVQERPLND